VLLVALTAAAPGTKTPAIAAGPAPRPAELRCLSECSGIRAGAEGAKLRISGKRLGRVDEVRFAGEPSIVAVAPDRAEATRLVVTVPPGAVSGRVRLVWGAGAKRSVPDPLTVVSSDRVPQGFSLRSAHLTPKRAFFDQRRPIRLRYRFEASERTGVRIEVARKSSGSTIRTYRRPGLLPYGLHRQGWDGLKGGGAVAPDGAYRLRVGAFGRGAAGAGTLQFFGYRFPVRGSHGYGGYLQSFGAPRSGGRRHQGHDVYASCGTPLEAARGGRVQARAYDDRLYGHYVVIDVRASSADHMYAHMPSPSPFGKGDRVRTGERVGAVGKTGNARTTPCHLHFEIWPNGWRSGSPVDPEPALRRWDGWS